MKLNKQFDKARQARLDEKSKEYDGKDNPKNYKNMSNYELSRLIKKDADELLHEGLTNPDNFTAKKLCCDISNRCQMLWERLGEK